MKALFSNKYRHAIAVYAALLVFSIVAAYVHIQTLQHPYVGAVLRYEQNGWIVQDVKPEGKAGKGGVRAGDRLIEADGGRLEPGQAGDMLYLERIESAEFVRPGSGKPEMSMIRLAVQADRGDAVKQALAICLELLLLGIGGFAYHKKPESHVIRRFFGFNVLMAFTLLTLQSTVLLISDLILAVCSIWLPYVLLSFFIHFVFHSIRKPIRLALTALNYLAAGMSVFICLSIWVNVTPGWILELLHTGFLSALACIPLLAAVYCRKLDWIERNHLLVFVTVLMLGLSPYIFLYAIPELLGTRYIVPPEYALIGLVPLSATIMILLVKKKMIDIRLYIPHITLHVLFVGCTSVLFIVPTEALYGGVALKIVIFIVMIFAYQRSLHWCRRQMEKRNDWLEREKLKLSIELAERQNTRDLVTALAGLAHRMLDIEGVLFVWQYPGERLQVHATGAYAHMDNMKTQASTSAADIAKECSGSLVMRLAGTDEDKVLGYMCLGPKINDTLLSGEERVLLDRLRAEAFRLLTNAKLLHDLRYEYETMRDQNRTYVQRVDEMDRFNLKLLEAQQSERTKTSYFLHDQVLQVLIFISRDLEELYESQGDTARNKTRLWLKGLYGAQRDIRMLCDDLYPHIIDKLELKGALRWLVRSMKENGEVEIELIEALEDGSGGAMSPAIKATLFRIIRELATNSAKHARATRIQLEVQQSHNIFSCTVSDNGVGFAAAAMRLDDMDQGAPSIGLISVRNQIRYMGGAIEIDSAPGHGTSISITVPILEKEEGRHDRHGKVETDQSHIG
ncbi:ATP-binding protein [Paenibacillus motobuensis]|uniref:ATP-binding protein n=1 Tax=Paenibacillus TaxID=44249 RepID=UPI00203FA90C|nr:ATP-binding protein [Paenibacillus lutimineralis]MCM3646023.1 ATP-binding protein [Paenibacillus motobuensis]